MDSSFRAGALHTHRDAALTEIARQLRYWVAFDRRARDAEGLATPPETHIVSPPHWPTHGQLARWADELEQAAASLSLGMSEANEPKQDAPQSNRGRG